MFTFWKICIKIYLSGKSKVREMDEDKEIKIISERLKEVREKRGLTKKELALKIGVSPSTITRYEEEGRVPKLTILKRISEVLDVSIDYLLGKEEVKIATCLSYGDLSDLPEPAIKSIEEFVDFVRKKYGKK
ncbi:MULTISPECIES: helix-turn-helix domain-containing protein [Dictyoglomus]|jgi:transcriptional regulator with XRE-family HTH domain|nr:MULTISPECIES: helix-turn-helix transcriptional regulator [Dictyoglomus]